MAKQLWFCEECLRIFKDFETADMCEKNHEMYKRIIANGETLETEMVGRLEVKPELEG